jgi:hypothetical protein
VALGHPVQHPGRRRGDGPEHTHLLPAALRVVELELEDQVLDGIAGVVDLDLVQRVRIEARGGRGGRRDGRLRHHHQDDAVGRGAGERVHVGDVQPWAELHFRRVHVVRAHQLPYSGHRGH